jgi:hypothetical protein
MMLAPASPDMTLPAGSVELPPQAARSTAAQALDSAATEKWCCEKFDTIAPKETSAGSIFERQEFLQSISVQKWFRQK